LCLLLHIPVCLQAAQNPEISVQPINNLRNSIDITIPIEQGRHIYADSIQLSVTHPAVSLEQHKPSVEPVVQYDTTFKENRKVFRQPVTLSCIATTTAPNVNNAYLRLVYYTSGSKNAIEHAWPLRFGSATAQPDTAEQATMKTQTNQHNEEPIQAKKTSEKQQSPSWFKYLQDIATQSHIIWIRILIAFILGLLLSLTPCIYPMIPITIGILQAQGAPSVWRNFSLALAYTLGIATTFALLGLAAALAGQAFGSFMNHPIVILLIVALLIYSALSLFGLYEMRAPRFMQRGNSTRGGSLIAAYIFGAASGTVASPCLSPGLLFMLTLVATLKNFWAGFILLFSFAIGLSIPLLIIGTFSGSLNLLPRAGSWMLEIKYLFGFMMLGMCFYFLAGILPAHILFGCLALFLLVTGIISLWHARKIQHHAWQMAWNILGMLTIAFSVFVTFRTLKLIYIPTHNVQGQEAWSHEYHQALNNAKNAQKNLFIFVHAPRCGACNDIEERLTGQRQMAALRKVVALKVNIADDTAPSTKKLIERFNILGAPVCILLDPQTDTVINRWDGELDDEQFNQMINKLEQQ
jgi:thiol:disulfide interchange protein DsbD